jgi:DUF1365 family protein
MQAIYEGTLNHTRTKPNKHAFQYRVHMLYLDLDDLVRTFSNKLFWSYNRFNLGCFLRSDYFGHSKNSLKKSIQDEIKKKLHFKHYGKIFVLTSPRYFGYCFNPVSFYYCFNLKNKLEVIVSHITNTPWNENHAYVHDCRRLKQPMKYFQFQKNFHVSPFMPMDIQYEWSFNEPGKEIIVSMNNIHKKEFIFNASMKLHRKPLNNQSLNYLLFKFPPETFKTIMAIYWNALRLKFKRIPFFSHP